MANVSGDGNFLSRQNQTLNAIPASIAKLFSALNIFLSVTASLGNAVILIALRKVSSIHPPTKLLFRSLAVTDLCVGLTVQPLYAATYIMRQRMKMNMNVTFNVYQIVKVSGWILCGVSVLTTTAISVDRFLALFLGLKYRPIVTLRRVRVCIACFWLVSASVGSIRIWRRDVALILSTVFLALSLVTSIFCYTRIHLKLRQQQAQVQNSVPHGQPNGGIPLNIARYKKTVSSIMWVQLALVVCYVPFGIVAVLAVKGIENGLAIFTTVETLVYLNSSLNPILYCCRIQEVREAVRGTVKQLKMFLKIAE